MCMYQVRRKSDNSKDSFYEELQQVFNHFPKYHMKSLLGDFNAKVGRENIFKPTNGNNSLHEDKQLCHIKKSSSEEHDVSAPRHS